MQLPPSLPDSRPPWRQVRRVALVAAVLLLLPTIVSGAGHVLASDGGTEAVAGPDVEDLTLITAQGRSPDVVNSPGGIELINTTTKERVWAHDRSGCYRYYDAEPLDESTLLITANCNVEDAGRLRLAIEHNWRTGNTTRAMWIPWDTHDVDKLDEHRYAVANIVDQEAYVYNYTAGEDLGWATYQGIDIKNSWRGDHEWSWNFTDHYPESAGGEEGYGGDWTHLNDVDSIYDGRAFLLSPRDFNRVIAVDRTTNEVMWTLGEQHDQTILDGQHHPVLLSTDPPTLLVGDSNNHRVVEYQREADGDWTLTWAYRTGLNWPRSVDRLPNGNTLITDTGNDRVIEVAPNGTLVWEYATMANPYEAERYAYGDEPQGPTMASVRGEAGGVDGTAIGGISALEYYHRIAGFVLPQWIGKWAFLGLVLAVLLSAGVAFGELGRAVRRRLA